jgi:Glycosyl transferase family 11
MITFSEIGFFGRLGNAMFQYAALKALAHKLNCKAILPNDLFLRIHDGQICLLNCFEISGYQYNLNNIIGLNQYEENCQGGHYSPDIWKCKINTNLIGYFESELYFKHIKSTIKRELSLKPEYDKFGKNYIKNIKNSYPKYEIIGVHLRRGDYLNTSLGKYCSEEWNKMYFNRCFKQYADIDKKIFIVFTGGSVSVGNNNQEDIEWCKQLFDQQQMLYSENHSTIEDYSIMVNCDHLIINSLSTIAWWAAYQNKNEKKRICVPINMGNKNDQTYWFDECIKIDAQP